MAVREAECWVIRFGLTTLLPCPEVANGQAPVVMVRCDRSGKSATEKIFPFFTGIQNNILRRSVNHYIKALTNNEDYNHNDNIKRIFFKHI